jgi:nicotinate phosphoribosyltransferase
MPFDRALAEGVLFTDQYELTMAQLYLREGMADRPARFEHFFRSYPDYGRHQAGYCVAAGIRWFLDWLHKARFDGASLDALRSQFTSTGSRMFDEAFLRWLGERRDFSDLRIEAIPEGRAVHPGVPMTVIEGPLALTQIVETALRNMVNFQTLIAPKASRVGEAAAGGDVLEFGMRRGPERGATAGSRAALIGGASHTSAVGLSYALGLSPKGTHAHSMIQAFMAAGAGELDAFRAYARAYRDDCLLLVDTIDTLESGVPNAITVFRELADRGHRPVGVRLDSGDLAHLAVRVHRSLAAAGFGSCSIVLSSNLDELTIWQIRNQIAAEASRAGVDPGAVLDRLVYGVGTKMATSDGDPSLDGVYKLVAYDPGSGWRPAIKLSDTQAKVINPGRKKVIRIYDDRGTATADLLALVDEDVGEPLVLHHPSDYSVSRTLTAEQRSGSEMLLEPAVPGMEHEDELGAIEAARARRRADLDRLDAGVRRIINPHVYHVSLSDEAIALKQRAIEDLRRR